LEDDEHGGQHLKSEPDRECKNALALIMRGLNTDLWVVNRSGPNAMKDHVKRDIPEMMISKAAVLEWCADIEYGELFVRATLS
jgi:hypothetical protein